MPPRARPPVRPLAGWVAVALSSAAAAAAAAATPATAPADADLRSWVAQLDAPDPAARAAAERHLADAGSRAIPVLTDARADPRPEVAARAARALRRVRLFCVRGVALDALPLAQRYLDTDTAGGRVAVLEQLVAITPTPVPVLVRLIALEPVRPLRSRLLTAVGASYRDVVPALTAEGDADAVDALVELATADLPYVGAADAAALAQATGQQDDAVARWQAELTNGDEPHRAWAAGVLWHLSRAAGRPDDAADMARRTDDPKLILLSAVDRRDWPAAIAAADRAWPDDTRLPLRAALARLAGHEADVSATVRAIAPPAGTESLPPAKVKLLLGDVTDGLARLAAPNTGDLVALARALRFRGDHDGALAAADRAARDPQTAAAAAPVRADLRQLLGDDPMPAPTANAADPDPAWSAAVAHLAAKRFADAAADLADLDRTDCRWVRGYALDAAGDHDRGQAMMRSADLALLADPAARLALARRLTAAGLPDAAAAQRQLAGRLANPFLNSVATEELAEADRLAAARRHDGPAEVAAAERVWLLSFWPGLTWTDAAAYLAAPADVHLARAHAARDANDWPAVAAELAAYQTFVPYPMDLALEWVPLLDAHGDHAAADALFATVYDHYDAASTAHPRSPYLHNQSAWLAACCNRRLDAATAHARSAIALTAGHDWQFVDTLAECHFRRGDRPAATAAERTAAALVGADPAYAARQLARFATAPVPSTTQPAAAPE